MTFTLSPYTAPGTNGQGKLGASIKSERTSRLLCLPQEDLHLGSGGRRQGGGTKHGNTSVAHLEISEKYREGA